MARAPDEVITPLAELVGAEFRCAPELKDSVRSVDELHEDPDNVNRHDDRNLEAIARSLVRFGQTKPIVALEDGIVIAGNGTLQAARFLQWPSLAVTTFVGTAEEARAYAIADNQTARLAEWDYEGLRIQLGELIDEDDVDLIAATGFDGDELAMLLRDDDELGGEADDDGPDTSKDDDVDDDAVEALPLPNRGDRLEVGRHRIVVEDCLTVLRSLDDESVDSIVTDPPYGIGLMGKEWDAAVPGEEWARECLRVLKPGGHLIAFAATRTIHRLMVAVEDGGFEIRDMISWLQWQGFPKSLDVSAAIDKRRHESGEILQVTKWIAECRDKAGIKNKEIDEAFGFKGMASHWTSRKSQPSVPTLDQVPKLLELLGVDDPPDEIQRLILDLNSAKGTPGPNWFSRAVTGHHDDVAAAQKWEANYVEDAEVGEARERRDEAHSPEAKRWKGWGTALKPAQEPMVLARKPTGRVDGYPRSVADCATTFGTGAINVDGCRYAPGDLAWPGPGGEVQDSSASPRTNAGHKLSGHNTTREPPSELGRWPANVYACPKPATAERTESGGKNIHPTVKPVHLMRWLVRLVTPPGGVVVDTFLGSGTTMVAVEREGFSCIGTELSPEYARIAYARILHAVGSTP